MNSPQVAIVGGGIAGAQLALLLVQEARLPPADILLFERERPMMPAAGTAIDRRVFAFSPASIHMLAGVGAWQRLDATRIAAIERMAVWPAQIPADSPDVLRFDAAESGDARLGVIAESRAVQASLLAACAESGIRIVTEPLSDIRLSGGEAVLRYADQSARAALLVGADGADSVVRAAAGIAVSGQSYGQTAIVAAVHAARHQAGTAFQRFLATGPLALLPLPGEQYSIVWSATDDRARGLLEMPEAAFAAELTRASDSVAGDLRLASPRAGFPLRRLEAARYVSGCCVLIGDAAHVIHPLAGQGVNQGLQDAAALAAHLARRPAGESVGAQRALRRYERERRAGNALMAATVDGLHGLFSRDPSRALLAGAGMALVGRAPPLRRLLTQVAAGRSSPRR